MVGIDVPPSQDVWQQAAEAMRAPSSSAFATLACLTLAALLLLGQPSGVGPGFVVSKHGMVVDCTGSNAQTKRGGIGRRSLLGNGGTGGTGVGGSSAVVGSGNSVASSGGQGIGGAGGEGGIDVNTAITAAL
ncbi:hypothetical protein V8C86DRAFT_3119808 [Haematococcus lacustris]